jgi:protein-disulfide isomerase
MKGSWDRLERTLLVVLAVSALVMAAQSVATWSGGARERAAAVRPARVEYWAALRAVSAELVRGASSGVELYILTDYQCPACRRFESERRKLGAADVGVRVVHFPLRQHQFARRSAAAAVCADRQGRFPAMHEWLFEHQDSLGLVLTEEMGMRVGVPDIRLFGACIRDPRTLAAVDSSFALSVRAGATGTPTVLLNGWAYPGVPSAKVILADVERLRRGNSPAGVGRNER